jgi:hypothetical protein
LEDQNPRKHPKKSEESEKN